MHEENKYFSEQSHSPRQNGISLTPQPISIEPHFPLKNKMG